MQWCTHLHAGFSTVEPWLPITDDFQTANVSVQSDNPRSLLTLYRKLLSLRRESAALNAGDFKFLESSPQLLAYQRQCDQQRYLIVLNFGEKSEKFRLPGKGRVVLSTALDREEAVEGETQLRGLEGIVVSCDV